MANPAADLHEFCKQALKTSVENFVGTVYSVLWRSSLMQEKLMRMEKECGKDLILKISKNLWPVINLRWSLDCLRFIMGIPILVT